MQDPFTDDTSKISRSGRIKTSSPLRRLWLTLFQGYFVERTLRSPKGFTLGRLTYETSWVLARKGRRK